MRKNKIFLYENDDPTNGRLVIKKCYIQMVIKSQRILFNKIQVANTTKIKY